MGQKNQITTSNPLKYDEFQRLLSCLHKDKHYRWEMYARLSFCTACRVSDVVNLRWEDVLGKSVILVVEKKTGKPRKVRFNPTVQKSFHELWMACECPDKSELILPSNRKKDAPFSLAYINNKLRYFKWKYKIDIENFSTHTFRKTFGRYVYESSNKSAESLVLLNRILNHSSIQMTKTYIGITDDEVESIYNSIAF